MRELNNLVTLLKHDKWGKKRLFLKLTLETALGLKGLQHTSHCLLVFLL